MGVKSIKFTDLMTAAILGGIKTETRRIIKPQPDTTEAYLRECGAWVEGLTLSQHLTSAWQAGFIDAECPYGEPGDHLQVDGNEGLLLEITEVRIARIQETTIGEICKEGLARSIYDFQPVTQAIPAFAELWGLIYGPGSWDANPWVWCISFKRIDHYPEDV